MLLLQNNYINNGATSWLKLKKMMKKPLHGQMKERGKRRKVNG